MNVVLWNSKLRGRKLMAVDSCKGFLIFYSNKWRYFPEYRQENLKSHKIKSGSVFLILAKEIH